MTNGLCDSWEYKMLQQDVGWNGVDTNFNAKLNELGREGWELVSAVPNFSEGLTTTITYMFKRILLEDGDDL